VLSGMRRAPAANSSSGIAVIGPMPINKALMTLLSAGKLLLPCQAANASRPKAAGASSIVSSVKPSSAPNAAVLRISP